MKHHQLTYAEYLCPDLKATSQFFEQVFGWTFKFWGPDYAATQTETLEIGFFRGEAPETPVAAPLLGLYSDNLEQTEQAILSAGGEIHTPTFHFPGGRRFHFLAPGSVLMAVWSNKDADGQIINES